VKAGTAYYLRSQFTTAGSWRLENRNQLKHRNLAKRPPPNCGGGPLQMSLPRGSTAHAASEKGMPKAAVPVSCSLAGGLEQDRLAEKGPAPL
jgi:hypothetical protein